MELSTRIVNQSFRLVQFWSQKTKGPVVLWGGVNEGRATEIVRIVRVVIYLHDEMLIVLQRLEFLKRVKVISSGRIVEVTKEESPNDFALFQGFCCCCCYKRDCSEMINTFHRILSGA